MLASSGGSGAEIKPKRKREKGMLLIFIK